jgi:hypothetical protein
MPSSCGDGEAELSRYFGAEGNVEPLRACVERGYEAVWTIRTLAKVAFEDEDLSTETFADRHGRTS